MLVKRIAACTHLSSTVYELQRDISRKLQLFRYPLHLTPPLGCCHQNSGKQFGPQKTKAKYRRALRNKEKRSTSVYTNALHEQLINKDGPSFWKCWRSKFDTRAECNAVGGCVDDASIANNFAQYFSQIYTPNSPMCAPQLCVKNILSCVLITSASQ